MASPCPQCGGPCPYGHPICPLCVAHFKSMYAAGACVWQQTTHCCQYCSTASVKVVTREHKDFYECTVCGHIEVKAGAYIIINCTCKHCQATPKFGFTGWKTTKPMTPIGAIRIWWDTSVSAYRMASPFSQELVDVLHKVIPYSDRSFDKPTKIWTFNEPHLTPLLSTLKLLGVSPTVITRQQAEAAATQSHAGAAASTRGEPIDAVIVRFVRLVPADAMQKAYRAAAIAMHPDKGGDANKMSALNAAWDRIQKEVYNG